MMFFFCCVHFKNHIEEDGPMIPKKFFIAWARIDRPTVGETPVLYCEDVIFDIMKSKTALKLSFWQPNFLGGKIPPFLPFFLTKMHFFGPFDFFFEQIFWFFSGENCEILQNFIIYISIQKIFWEIYKGFCLINFFPKNALFLFCLKKKPLL